ncbi:Biotin carboxyl carrier protein of acetyl-CoA carboxylase [Bienertia sinuspersici]
MAASSLGVPNSQILSSRLNHKSCCYMPSFPCILQAGHWPKSCSHPGIMLSQCSHKPLIICHAKPSLIMEHETAASTIEAEEDKTSISGPTSQLIPNSDEVKSLLTEICDTTSIAEFELKLNGFHLHVTRALSTEAETPPSQPDSVSMSANTTEDAPSSNGPVSPSSLAITKAGPAEITPGTMLERAADEGLVGFFRRSRTIKGKRAPPACKEKQVVKEGQVICYIEQLGGEIPVESDVSGEVTKILFEDGEPVGYGDAVMVILPSFPGIKKLQLDG